MAFSWLRRLFAAGETPQPRLATRVTTLENDLSDLDSKLEHLESEHISLRSRVYALKRGEKVAQDPSGEEIEEEPDSRRPPQRPVTAHLARRFRGV